ncbi:MAG: hypothetical protein ACNI3C_04620 [Candidatus Marinarcus sp.]|uniref:hypothetical protein n=1 Tax=Candidatus Marinarcus sp. TaxID=3100987 RepID=UPI003B00000C
MNEAAGFPLEIISNIVSLAVVIAILYKLFQYKKKITVIQGLSDLQEKNELTSEDKAFVASNLQEYKIQYQKDQALIKLAYPVFILIIGLLMFAFSTKEALIHINIVVVTLAYLFISKIHTSNYIKLLEDIQKQ